MEKVKRLSVMEVFGMVVIDSGSGDRGVADLCLSGATSKINSSLEVGHMLLEELKKART